MKGEAGFTLVELLAALVAGGLLLAVVGMMTGTFGTELRTSSTDDAFGEIATIAPLLDRLLSDATPSSPGHPRFDGDARHLIARVPPPEALGPVGPLRMDLEAVNAQDGQALDMTLTAIETSEPHDDRLPFRRRLVHGLRSVSFAYRRDALAEPGSLPRLIQIAFTTAKAETWTLAIAPRLTAAGGCTFDPISMTCRK